MQYSTVQCNTIQCNTIQCNTVQCNTVQCSGVEVQYIVSTPARSPATVTRSDIKWITENIHKSRDRSAQTHYGIITLLLSSTSILYIWPLTLSLTSLFFPRPLHLSSIFVLYLCHHLCLLPLSSISVFYPVLSQYYIECTVQCSAGPHWNIMYSVEYL